MSDRPRWADDVLRWRELVEAIAVPQGLSQSIVLAVVAQESSGRPGAWRPEPKYRWLWNVSEDRPFREVSDEEIESEVPPDDFPRPIEVSRVAEWWGQQASWGLMQVMGAVARERGFWRPDLPDLTQPTLGIVYGVRQLTYFRKRFRNEADMLAAYNGGPGAVGGNREYVDAVDAKRRILEDLL